MSLEERAESIAAELKNRLGIGEEFNKFNVNIYNGLAFKLNLSWENEKNKEKWKLK